MALSIHSRPHSNADSHAEGQYTHLPTNVNNSSPEGVLDPNGLPSIQDRGIRVTLAEGVEMRPQCINSPYHDAPPIEESIEARLERLGRQRNMVFGSIWSEEYFVSGFTVILPTLVAKLDIPAASTTWPASAFSLTVASFLMVFARLADMYGGYPLYVAGFVWFTLWTFVAGFSTNEIMLNLCRALQGLGSAAFLPSSVMIIGSVYRPGPRKNMVFSIYGASAAGGFWIGIFFGGLTTELISWRWYFWIGAILSAVTAVASYITIPSDIQEKKGTIGKNKMDWIGAILISTGFILSIFAIVDSSHAPNQWRTPYIYIFFVIGILLLLGAIYYECAVAAQPLIPPSIFRVPRMPALFMALFFTYGSLGIYLLYATFYMERIMGASPLQVVAWYVPMALGGCMIATFGGFILHLLHGTFLIIAAGASWIIAPLLFAIAPEGANYWTYIFPSMCCATIGIDITFTVANIFITTSLPRKQQGLAGGVTMLLLHLGTATMLGFADIVNTYTVESIGQRKSYQAVLWLEVACASFALVIMTLFVKIKKAESELTIDELTAAAALILEPVRDNVQKGPEDTHL